jgi:hypothetical protein
VLFWLVDSSSLVDSRFRENWGIVTKDKNGIHKHSNFHSDIKHNSTRREGKMHHNRERGTFSAGAPSKNKQDKFTPYHVYKMRSKDFWIWGFWKKVTSGTVLGQSTAICMPKGDHKMNNFKNQENRVLGWGS